MAKTPQTRTRTLTTANWLNASVIDRAHIDGVTPHRLGPTPYLATDSLPSLIQIIGYLKQLGIGQVYLRGQTSLYGGQMAPSLLRQYDKLGPATAVIDNFVQSIVPWTCDHVGHAAHVCDERAPRVPKGQSWRVANSTRRYAVEPLLQHYGFNTRWLDVVDNLWVALWFACHNFRRRGRYMHAVRHRGGQGSDLVYIIVALIPGPLKEVHPGLRVGRAGSVVDLRVAAPSFYVRPHAQHGLLVRPRLDDQRNLAYAAIGVRVETALTWLGESVLLSPYGLFPPMDQDYGHRGLLEGFRDFPIPQRMGDVDVIGPGF